jgi:tetratricopeptide (TPR) repeat protein
LAKSRPPRPRPGPDSRPAPEGAATPAHAAAQRSRFGKTILAVAAAAALLVCFGVIAWPWLPGGLYQLGLLGRTESPDVATFVGTETCAGCHRAQADLWRDSQHKHAMDHATEKTVLGDFNSSTFEYYDVRSRFFRKDGKFFVETDGPDGKLATFQVKYTFGIDPLQQYLIEFPDGRIQALSIAWDSRSREKGGQRWFHLYPNENIRPADILHWTKLNQNWNFMCSECHSTGVRKNYDAVSDRYATTWSEISVGCEACHGQGSRHVAWARSQQSWLPFNRREDRTKGLPALFNERQGVVWSHSPRSGELQRNLPTSLLRTEVETCGRCHARRSEISEAWVPGRWLLETHAIASPMARDVYWADGQIRDVEEAYNYVPFKQSKMFAAGVTCSDCHDPHSGKQKFAGDGVCLQCHSSETYASAKHSHHEQSNAAPNCISCHMPARTYMMVDARHDHSLRIPRPDLSVKLGTPNACNYCHTDKSAQWAADSIERWFGPARKGFQTYAGAFRAASGAQADAERLLALVAADGNTPDVARASALIALAPYVSPANADLARRGLSDPDPMVRIGAMNMLSNVPAAQIWTMVAPLLSDPVRSVRAQAASLLAAVPIANQPQADRERFESAAAEFVAVQQLNADRPENRSTLANFYARRGLRAEAEAEYKAALRLSSQYTPAAINLADLYRASGREPEGLAILRDTVAAAPPDAGLHYALGLALTRQKQNNEALAELRRATELAPDHAQYAYVYAVGLHSAGRVEDALSILKENLAKHPTDRDSLLALVSFNRDAGNIATALDYAQRLAQIAPNDRRVSELVDTLRRQLESSPQ